ncbi:EF-hand domain-containing protein [Sphingobium aromaticiconvertens]|uniref:EF-hand domain-containing protein n=1 Tax=Sphingobium aromaticiconvertens TaxID=365341 RepID=UPI0030181FD9
MIRTLLCSTALMIAAPAIAQTAAPAQQDPSAAAAQSATPAAPADQAAPADAQAAPANPANSVAAIVDSEFPAYDANKDGQLDQAEFGKWMVALKDQEMKATGKTLPPAEVTAWANGAFTSADADKSTAVSKTELVTYLSGGAG